MDTPQQLSLGLSAPQEPTLDNFVIGENAEAIASVRAFIKGEGPQFLYLWGGHGCGCTHLIKAVTPKEIGRVPTFNQETSIYTVDDVESLTAEEQEALFALMNAVRSNPETRLLIAGHAPVRELKIREDIRSRLAWGLVFELRYLDDESAAGEFVRQAHDRGIELDKEVTHWVAAHCPRDMRSLRALLDGVDAYAMEQKRKVTLPLLLQYISQRGSLWT